MSNHARFSAVYAEKLEAAMQKHSEEYSFPVERAPDVAEKMTTGLAEGSANLGPAAKAAARALGIKPTMRDIKRYLNLDNCPCAAMGCLCAGHARGVDPSLPCDASEQ